MAVVASLQDNTDSPLVDDGSNEDNDQMSSASSGDGGGSPGSARRATKSPVDPAAGSFVIGSSVETGQQHRKAKRYRHTAAAKGSANPASGPSALSSQQKASPTKRRIMRKDRRTTLETLTSDDEVNEYREARPSSYIEPAARRSLHEVKPHFKSSFETLYNPEFNYLAAEDSELPSLSLSSSSCNSADEGSKTENCQAKKDKKSPEFWPTASGPKVSNTYLDVTQSSSDVRDESSKDKVDKSSSTQLEKETSFGAQRNLDEPILSFQRPNVKGPVVDKPQGDLNGASKSDLPSRPTNGDNEWAITAKNQPLNVSIKVSKSSTDQSVSLPKGTTIGVDLEIALSQPVTVGRSPPANREPAIAKQATASAESEFVRDSADDKKPTETLDRWAKLPARLALLPDKVSPGRTPNPEHVDISLQAPTGQTSSVVEKPRGRRVLPAVPDSADLEVSDLLRETQESTAADRPKSAVELLVAKNRSSSILQAPSQPDAKSTSKVSQQLRFLFHNPSPLIMLQRAATRPILPISSPTKAETIEFAAQQQANKYQPLRSSQQRADENLRSASAVLYPESPNQESLSQVGQGAGRPPPELPFRGNRSLLSNQGQAQQPEPPRPQSAAVFLHAAPPPVPPRQAKTSVTRQHPLSTFYPSTVQLAVSRSSSTAPPIAARSLRESPQALRQGTGVKTRDGELQSVDQLYKRIQQLPDRSAKHTLIVDSSMGLNGSSGEYLLAGEASSERLQLAQQEYFPSRIQTNPHMLGRARDSLTRRVELGDYQGEGNAPVTNAISATPDLPIEPSEVTKVNARRMEDFIRRFGHLSRQQRENEGDKIAKQPTARDRLFSDQTRADESIRSHDTNKRNPNSVHVVQAAASTMESRSNGALSLTRTPSDSPSAVSQLPAERNGKGMRVPPNAVRVLPREDGELRERMRALGSRSNGGRSPRPAEDAVAGLEKMCRDMRLEDESLLDGAERRDTSERLQSRINALNSTAPEQPTPVREAPSSRGVAAERPYFVQHRGLFPFNRKADDQARRFKVDSNRKDTATVKSEPHLRLVRETGTTSSNDPKASSHSSIVLTHRQPIQDQRQSGNVSQHVRSAPPILHLQPGEREKGPEIIL